MLGPALLNSMAFRPRTSQEARDKLQNVSRHDEFPLVVTDHRQGGGPDRPTLQPHVNAVPGCDSLMARTLACRLSLRARLEEVEIGIKGGTQMGWTDPVYGQLDTGDDVVDVTFKDKLDSAGDVTDTLIAPGYVEDIQNGVDHVHAWGQNTDEPDHHDLRHGDAIFPDTPGLF